MKRLLLTLFTLIVSAFLFAQSPNLFNYQGVARDLAGNPLINKNIGLRITLLQGSTTGSEVYKELFLRITNNLGLFNIQIGNGTVVKGTIGSIDWSKGPYFLKIELDPNATNDFQDIGTSQLISVPYALYAKTSENGFSGNYNDLTNKPVGVNKGEMQYWNGTKWELVPPGANGQVLRFVNGIPAWVSGLPYIRTVGVSNVTGSEATSGGTSISDGGEELIARGVCWSSLPYPTVTDNKTNNGTGIVTFTATITGLNSNSTYYIRAYATNSQGTAYGNQVTCTTSQNILLATVATASPTTITSNSAIMGGNVTSEGNASVTDRGIVFATTQTPTVINNKIPIGSGTGVFSTTVTGLAPNTTYFIRAYATSSQGTAYGNEQSFTTLQNPVLATVTTASPTTVTSGSAVLGGTIISDGYAAVTDRGIVYATTQNPTVANTKTQIGSGTGAFSTTVTGLTASTTYFARAYATNSQGTAYGNEQSFTTLQNLSPASVTTATPTNITSESAALGGNVINDGFATVTERGIVYATTQTPTTASNKVVIGSGTGTFITIVSGLVSNTTYYVRAFAINSQGTAYGNEQSFTTPVNPSIASVTTASPTTITAVSAVLGGNVISDGFAAVTERGIVYSTSPNPNIANNKTPIGSGTGAFNTIVSGLVTNTTYYVKAYAINGQGTAYGNEQSFTTLQNQVLPSVSTVTPTAVTGNSAVLGGNVSSDGFAAVTERGICYATTQNPTTANNKLIIGSGVGTFTSTVTALAVNTTFYARAYATNNVGTAYGNQVSFTTLQSVSMPSVTTASPTTITAASAVLGGIVTSDGNTIVTERGIAYSSTSHNPVFGSTKIQVGSGSGSFSTSVTGLTASTTYNFWAYATNSEGTVYGNENSFTTLPAPAMAAVSTSTPTTITQVSAFLGGLVSSDGNASVTERGIVYATTQSPTTAGDKTVMGTGTGMFGAVVSGLATNTTYYARAYAINSQGTSYGNELSFVTLQNPVLATVSTASPTTITSNSAVLGGNVVSDGNATVTERGICFSTSPNPTVADNKTIVGNGTGTFSTTVTGLASSTTYYVRAFAINSAGTAYGPQVSFTSSQ